MTIPTKAMKGNEDIRDRLHGAGQLAGREDRQHPRAAPRGRPRLPGVLQALPSRRPAGIFDDVFVPKERIFLDGETPYAAIFAHLLGLWERLGGLSGMADGADQLVGFAQLIAEANGLASVGHIKEKISEMIIHATLARRARSRGYALQDRSRGRRLPRRALHSCRQVPRRGELQHDGPPPARHRRGLDPHRSSVSDLENPETGNLIKKYMRTMDGVDGEYRTRLFHALRDLTADARTAGWRWSPTSRPAEAVRAAHRHAQALRLENAKRMALAAAGMDESDVH